MIRFLFVFLKTDSDYRIEIDNLIRSTDTSTDDISGSSRSISADIYESNKKCRDVNRNVMER